MLKNRDLLSTPDLSGESAPARADLGPGSAEGTAFPPEKVDRILRQLRARQLRDLIHACEGNPDTPAVQEFLRKHEDDRLFVEMAQAIVVAFREDYQLLTRLQQPDAKGTISFGEKVRRFLGRFLGW